MKSAGSTVLNFDLTDSSVDSVCESVMETCLLDTTSFGWTRNISSVPSNPLVATALTEDLMSSSVEAVMTEETKPDMTPDDVDYIKEKAKTYEEYCISTVLPSLSKVFISIAREKPEDPLFFAIQSLTDIADHVERAEELEARKAFEDILANSKT